MDSAKSQLADKIKASNNILVTVSRNPSVDQLSALLGLTLTLNKMGKHAAAVFSGQVPSTLEFLQPEETFEKNTDSLRDFIIALDKSKADKLRYKVEDEVVRIFITPYKTSISDADLEFSQGDFNVDVVVAIGVRQQEELDEAITAHGRILHDATVASINVLPDGGLGSINWYDEHVSSLSELTTELVQVLDTSVLDEQISTALLTGIVAETDRFSNEKTSSQTMSLSAVLMAAGANQQLVATKLEEPGFQPEPPKDNDQNDEDGTPKDVSTPDEPKPDDGALEIDHNDDKPEPSFDLPSPQPLVQPEEAKLPEIIIDENPKIEIAPPEPVDVLSPGAKMMVEPPSMGGRLTANTTPEEYLEPAPDPLALPNESHHTLLNRDEEQSKPTSEHSQLSPPPPSWTHPVPEQTFTPTPTPPPAPDPIPVPDPVQVVPPTPAPEPQPVVSVPQPTTPDPAVVDTGDKTLTELEAAVGSPHLTASPNLGSPNIGDARDEVSRALGSDVAEPKPEPIQALNAQPLGDHLNAPASPSPGEPGHVGPMLEDILAPPQVIHPDTPAPPPVPPPLPFKLGTPGNPQQ